MKPFSRIGLFRLLACLGLVCVSSMAHAIEITATQDTNTLINALLGGGGTGMTVTNVTLNGHQELGFGQDTATSSGTYTNASGTYGIGPGVVLSTGSVTALTNLGIPGYGDGPNTVEDNSYAYGALSQLSGVPATAAQEALLDPITGHPNDNPPVNYDHFDVTELIIKFDMQPGFDKIAFNVVFGSEEYPEFVASQFVDGFGLFVNGVNIAQVNGNPVNIQHPDVAAIPGTELDGILAPGGNPRLTFSRAVTPGSTDNELRFIVADTSDAIYDTTVYFSTLRAVPLPGAAWLFGAAISVLGLRRRQRCNP